MRAAAAAQGLTSSDRPAVAAVSRPAFSPTAAMSVEEEPTGSSPRTPSTQPASGESMRMRRTSIPMAQPNPARKPPRRLRSARDKANPIAVITKTTSAPSARETSTSETGGTPPPSLRDEDTIALAAKEVRSVKADTTTDRTARQTMRAPRRPVRDAYLGRISRNVPKR